MIVFGSIFHYTSYTNLNSLKVIDVIVKYTVYLGNNLSIRDVTKAWTLVTSVSCVKNDFK